MTVQIRPATEYDLRNLTNLYKSVAAVPGGLARSGDEINLDFIANLWSRTSSSGLMLVLEDGLNGFLLGAIHAVHGKSESLRHVMSQLTILVHPRFQSQGLGKRLFTKFLETVQTDLPSILRVELRARASNLRALKLYENLGFVAEGRFYSRIKNQAGEFEDGIPMVWFNPDWRGPNVAEPNIAEPNTPS